MTVVSLDELLGPLNSVERKNAPKILYAQGDVGLLQRAPRISIVGTRRPSASGIAMAGSFARSFAARHAIVVSGLAEGIDTAAHQAAIEAGGRTIAVLGNSLDVTFPGSNRELQGMILEKHLGLSQFPPGTGPRPGNFPQRDRTMALVSNATVIIEAGEGSGTLHQGWEALRLGRPLFLVETLLRDPSLRWPSEMVRYGAVTLPVDTPETVLDFVPEWSRESDSRLTA